MEKRLDEINEAIGRTEEMVLLLRRGADEAWNYVNANMEKMVSVMTEIVTWAQRMVSKGVDVPIEVILQQIQNLNEAYTKQDEVLLADTLEYEITNALYLYLEEGEKQDVV